jgi:WD40 repeat protein
VSELAENPKQSSKRVDFAGDPLPEGALARMGTSRLRGQALTFSPDGKTLITVGDDRAFHYYDVTNGRERDRKPLAFAAMEGRFDAVLRQKGRSADGHRYVSMDKESIRVWETATGKELHKIPFDSVGKGTSDLTVSNSGQTVAAYVIDFPARKFTLYIWNAATGKDRQINYELRGSHSPAFSTDGKLLAVRSESVIQLYDPGTTTELYQIDTQPEKNLVRPVSFSTDNSILAWVEGAYTVKLWNLNKKRLETSFQASVIGQLRSLRFSPDGKRLVVAGDKGVVALDSTSRKVLGTLAITFPHEFAISPDGRTLANSTFTGVRLYDLTTGKPLPQPEGHEGAIQSIAFSPDGKSLASATLVDPTIRLWETATGRPLLALNCPDHSAAILFAPDGQQVFAGDRKGTIHSWSAKTGEPMRKLEIHNEMSSRPRYILMRLATDGKSLTVLASRFERSLLSRHVVWDLGTGEVRKNTDFVGKFDAMFGPDGTTLHPENKMVLLDPLTGKQVVRLNEPSAGHFSFTWDSKKLAVGSLDVARIFDLATGREFAKIATGIVGDVEFSRDGRLLAAISREELSLWEVASGKRVYRLPAPAAYSAANGVSFSVRTAFAPDGKSIATGLKDGTILVWDIAPGFPRNPGDARKLDQKELEQLWTDLIDDDAAKAYRAIWTLAGSPDQAMPFLKDRLKPAVYAGKHIDKLIADLDSMQFAVRTAAFKELQQHDIEIESSLRRALKTKITPECRRRIEDLLALPPGIVRERESLRGVRAVRVLEGADVPRARDLLKRLAAGAAEARLTQEAAFSLERLR